MSASLSNPAGEAGRRRSALLGAGLLVLILALAPAAAEQTGGEPPYPHGSFQDDCSLCHQSAGWVPLRPDPELDHAKTGFPLTGAHDRAPCRSCHESLDFAAADSACVACHEDVHQAELGVDCARCHTTRSFIDRGQMRRAHLLTRFPLSGAHAAEDCGACHTLSSQGQLIYVNRSTDCQSCHLDDYRGTSQPDHQALGFSTDCEVCHTDVAWRRLRTGRGFDHAATGFALTGAHRRLDCQACHQGGVYSGNSADCVACHRADYDQTTSPDHQASGFSTDCASCHRTSAWIPASFDHQSFFPLSGPHGGRACSDCHVVPGDFSQFSCVDGCHHSDQNQVDRDHSQVNGYTYDSQACYSCHPRGRH